jgi:predicted nuclease of predicted toxin-antitoxin system
MSAFKLDENLGLRGQQLFSESGHDVSTVFEQDLSGVVDDALIQVCRVEKRCLVTLDLDFANPIHFPPANFAGIVVLRPRKFPENADILACLKTLLAALRPEISLHGKLWIVSASQVREYLPDAEEA